MLCISCEKSEQRLLEQVENVPVNRRDDFREFRSRGRVAYSARRVSRPADGNVTEPGVEPATCWPKDWGPNH